MIVELKGTFTNKKQSIVKLSKKVFLAVKRGKVDNIKHVHI